MDQEETVNKHVDQVSSLKACYLLNILGLHWLLSLVKLGFIMKKKGQI
jgi:hypothetical protein